MATQTSGEATGSDGSFITGDDIGAKEKMVAGREAFQGPSIGPSDPEKDIQAVPMGEDTMTAVEPDPGLVTWESANDPSNPLNFSKAAKWRLTILISLFSLISLVSMTMVAPGLPTISRELEVTDAAETPIILSVFLLAYAFGPLIFGPLSEEFGRVIVLQLSNIWFLIFNTVCGFSNTKSQLIAARFLSGFGGSATMGIGFGVLSGCWRAEERGTSIALFSVIPLMGPAIAPIAGGYIVEFTTYRWIFWSVSIFGAAIQFIAFLTIQETYAPIILGRKAKKLRKQTNNPTLHTAFDSPDKRFFKSLNASLMRPLRLLITQPIIQILAAYRAYSYGILFNVISTFPLLWTSVYHENTSTASLNYIALAVGEVSGTLIGQYGNDRYYRHMKQRNNGKESPQYRVPLMYPGAIFVPIGLFLYGWAGQYHVHWVVPDIGIAIFGFGSIMGTQSTNSYIVDVYTRYSASAMAATTFLRSLTAFTFPLFAPYLYQKLDYGWGNTLIAFLAILIGIPAPLLLARYGPRLRAKSRFAAGGLEELK